MVFLTSFKTKNYIECLQKTAQILSTLSSSYVLVSCGYLNKLHKLGYFKQDKFYFTVLDTRSTQSRYWQGHSPVRGSGGEFFLASPSFWWFLMSLGLWQHYARLCLCLRVAFPSLCGFVPLGLYVFSFKETSE